MELFDVYKMMPIALAYAKGYHVYDTQGREYLDFYGGHAVISIGHSHPHYIAALTRQLHSIGYYSNAVDFPLRNQLAEKLGELAGYEGYSLFLCNSGAEAMENALKLASFHTGKKKVVAFKGGFHGRTSAAVSITDNASIQAPINEGAGVVFLEPEREELLEEALSAGDVCAVVIEGIRGVGGIYVPSAAFLKSIKELCRKWEVAFICDEIQSGYGRTGKFFAHQHAGVAPDLITIAKGMGNGFPVGGVLIHPKFKASYGLLGTTFGGNPLACAASLAVLEVLEKEALINNAAAMGNYLKEQLKTIPEIVDITGEGLMLGISFAGSVKPIQQALTEEARVLTGSSALPNQIRLLPPLTIGKTAIDVFISKLKGVLAGVEA
ncbi:aspartate aminotransferase family protein [Cesiribacter andamanensis]|uniref:Acetylornithine aminotransferase n=1 Tax=Cesiribacter andamanensis AMV16 TaxID=1279009 RepID=M7P1C1_9BACT|nr:aminotransferase class III-fold pyridoxal phosphate-dependent enzyme [Cesiribacter andamanensis]EMR04409.1 Acetylornithine aminotransferase [Cesiribacter andamanensis AMV16]